MAQEIIHLFISVGADPYLDSKALDELARQLSDELDALDMVSAELARGGELPEGAKGGPIAIGTVLVKVAEVGGITALITALSSWLSRDERRAVTLQIGENKLEATSISAEEQADLIQWFKTQTGLRLEV